MQEILIWFSQDPLSGAFANSWGNRRTLLAKAIERRFPSSCRATTRVAPTMDGPGEPLPTWLRRGDPRGRPAGSLHARVLLHSHWHSPAKSVGADLSAMVLIHEFPERTTKIE